MQDRIREIEDEIRRTPYNKATQHHIGKLKARLAKLKEGQVSRKRGGAVITVRKSGDATVALVGFPSVGKSTLLNRITEARSKVGDYDFTTLRAVPGLLSHKGARIQVLDLPGITRGASAGRGRGKEVLSQVRIADLLVLMIDVEQGDLKALVAELHETGIRVNAEPPKLALHNRERGGIDVSFSVIQQELDEDMIRSVMREWGVINAELVVREPLTLERLIDFLAGNRAYVSGIVVLNKVDLVEEADAAKILEDLREWEVYPISATEGTGLDHFLDAVYSRLSLMRVYLRAPGEEAAGQEPLVLREGSNVADLCRLLHRDFVEAFKQAQVWGPSAKFPGQAVGMRHRLEDGDTVTIALRRG